MEIEFKKAIFTSNQIIIKKKKENQLANSKNAELETELAQLKAEKAQKGWKDSSR